MSATSSIEWTDATWNPVRGCTKVSPGCKNCYAETFAERFRGVPGHPYEYGFDLRLVPEKLAEPLKWTTPKTIFVNSMSDLFHEDVPDSYIKQVAQVMGLANWHTYQVLTKRPERMCNMLQSTLSFAAKFDHVWWGTSVENRKYGIPRINALRNTPVPIRFLSVEPLLEDLGNLDLYGIQWIIVGGESGAGARPLLESWVLNIRDLCHKARIPFFFKQWGGVRKAERGRLLQGRTHDEMPKRMVYPVSPKHKIFRALLEVESWSAAVAETLVPCTVGATKSP